MINNTFFIVFRTPDNRDIVPNPNQDRYGWELADGIEMFDYKVAQKMREEYQASMPHFAVRIRAIPIERKAEV